MTVAQSPTKLVPNTSTEHIQNLCAAFQKLQQPEKDVCMGFLLDAVQQKYGIFPLLGPHNCGQPHWTAFTLHRILTGKAATGKCLTQLDKLSIALDLSSSILQLYNTRWLDEHWGHKDIYFLQKPGAKPGMVYERPYVYRQLTQANTPSQTQQTKYRVIRNQTLYRLCIMLIEVLYGRSIEQLQAPPDLDCAGTPGVAWCTAERLLDNELDFEAERQYSDAVRRCICCNFDHSEMSLDDKGFQQAVFDGVVVPLETMLKQFRGELT